MASRCGIDSRQDAHVKFPKNKMERKTRFELATLALARRCSTPEPLPRNTWNVTIGFHVCQDFFWESAQKSGSHVHPSQPDFPHYSRDFQDSQDFQDFQDLRSSPKIPHNSMEFKDFMSSQIPYLLISAAAPSDRRAPASLPGPQYRCCHRAPE